MNLSHSILIFKYQCQNKFTVCNLEWIAADYMVLATILLACATWLWLAKNSEKMEKYRNSVKAILWFFIGITCILLVTDNRLQEQLYQGWHRFLELPAHDKVGFIMVVVVIVGFTYLFKMVRNWIITAYSITMYYLLVIGVRAVLFWYAVDPYIFLSVEGGLIFLSVVWVWVFCKKPRPHIFYKKSQNPY